MRRIAVSVLVVILCIPILAQQDTASAKKDSAAVKTPPADSQAQKPKIPEARPLIKFQPDTSFEAVNLERYYYGMDGRDASYDYNPWDEYLFKDADEREAAEREQRDQERDTRE